MKIVLPVALMFALAGGVQAQQLTEPRSTDNIPAVESRLAPVPTVQDLQNAPTEVKPIQNTERQVEEDATRNVADEAVVQDPTQRRWWWIVGAVVIGVIIAAALM